MARFASALAFFILACSAGQGLAHDCACKFEGGDAKQGETRCIKTAAGQKMARCEMVLNNSSWTVLDEKCLDQSARFPAKWNHFAEKDSRQFNMLEHVLAAKPLHTLAGHALTGGFSPLPVKVAKASSANG